MYIYRIGNIKLEAESINELKELAEQLRGMAKESGMDLPKHLNDVIFSIDVDYQRHHSLGKDNWDIAH